MMSCTVCSVVVVCLALLTDMDRPRIGHERNGAMHFNTLKVNETKATASVYNSLCVYFRSLDCRYAAYSIANRCQMRQVRMSKSIHLFAEGSAYGLVSLLTTGMTFSTSATVCDDIDETTRRRQSDERVGLKLQNQDSEKGGHVIEEDS